MLDEKDLLAIGQLMDQKLAQQKQDLLGEMAQQKQDLLGEMARQRDDILGEMDRRLTQQKDEILTEATHRMQVLLDAEVKPMFNLLAEDISIIREKMIPESRIEAVEDDVSVLKASVRQINRELRELKKAQ